MAFPILTFMIGLYFRYVFGAYMNSFMDNTQKEAVGLITPISHKL